MEEQKIPSRSERNKKKKKDKKIGLFFSSVRDQTSKQPEGIKTETKKSDAKRMDTKRMDTKRTDTKRTDAPNIEVSGTEWYFTPAREDQTLLVESKAEVIEERDSFQSSALKDNDSQRRGTAAHKKNRKRRSLNPAAGFVLLLVMLLGGVCCGYAAMNAVLPPTDGYYAGNEKQEEANNVNVLVLGCDEREGESVARADVIIVATLRPEAKKVSLFSLPRDTRVAIKGHGMDKVNHAMAYGGIPLVQDSVENLLGIQIDHYVKVNFDGFINVIDALGGVNIDVPTRMYKPLEAIDLLPGYQTLDGADALAFVRWRGDGTGDYGRIERQQQFIAALSEKLKGMSLSQTLDVASAVMDSIETDMSVKQMTSYGRHVMGMGKEDMKTYSFVGHELWINGVNYVEADQEAIANIVYYMQHGEPEPVAQETAEVDPAQNP